MVSETLMTSTITPPHEVQVFGEPQLHTDGDVLALAFALDGSLWSLEEPGVLRHWHGGSGQQLEWQALSDLETLWTFSRDARFLASASDDLTLWEASSGQVLAALPQGSWVTALTFAHDPHFLATGHDDGTVRYWNWKADTHQLAREFHVHRRAISALAVSKDGKILAAASEDKIISLSETATGKLLGKLPGHTDRIPALAFHPGGELLVSGGWDTTARVWNVRTLEPVILLNTHNAQATALAFNEEGTLLASADAGPTVHVWDFKSNKTLLQLRGPLGEIRCLTFSHDGKKLACNGEHMIHLWDPKSGQALAGAGPRPFAHTSVAVSRNGQLLASNGGGSTPRVWDTATRQTKFNLDEQEVVHAVAYSPDGRLLAGAAETHIRLWDATTGKVVKDLAEGFDEPATQVVFSADGKILASASCTGLDVWIWSVADGKPLFIIDDGLDGCVIKALAFHPAGRQLAVGGIDWLATGGSNGAISIWDIEKREQIGDFFLDGTTSLAFHPSGNRLASTSLDQSICIWNVDTKDIHAELTGHDNAATCVAYSPDGTWLASGGEDRTVRLWDADGQERALVEVDSQITGLTFSPDGQFLYTANANTTCARIKLSALLK
jgi:WD40 repeat protein